MANPSLDTDDDKPLDPAVETVRRKLIRFMIFNLGLLGVALIAVVAAIVYKSRTAAPEIPPAVGLEVPADGGVIEGGIALPAGARIVSQSLSGDRVSLYVEEPGGARAIYVYDLAVRRMVGHFAIKDRN
ncbi:MAG TPA: fimbrial protein [Mesorhizobium sp.]|jgi:hypothetical protein